MKNIRKTIHNYFVFILGIIFASCITALAETCNTTVSSNNISYTNAGTTQNANAAIAALSTKLSALDTRMTAITNSMNNKLSKTPWDIELTPSSGASHGGYIDFHFNGSGNDYTSRIAEYGNGIIDILAPNGVRINNVEITSPISITPTSSAGNIAQNRSFRIGSAVSISFLVQSVSIKNDGTEKVVANLPAAARPSAIANCSAVSQDILHSGVCYVKTNGDIVIKSKYSLITTASVNFRITGEYIK